MYCPTAAFYDGACVVTLLPHHLEIFILHPQSMLLHRRHISTVYSSSFEFRRVTNCHSLRSARRFWHLGPFVVMNHSSSATVLPDMHPEQFSRRRAMLNKFNVELDRHSACSSCFAVLFDPQSFLLKSFDGVALGRVLCHSVGAPLLSLSRSLTTLPTTSLSGPSLAYLEECSPSISPLLPT